jgi:AhpD family alkylhydroperoxidase
MRVDYHKLFHGGMRAIAELERALHSATLEPELLELVRVRASQINGCTYCLAMHNRDARARGEHQTRLEALTELPRADAPDDVYTAVGSA